MVCRSHARIHPISQTLLLINELSRAFRQRHRTALPLAKSSLQLSKRCPLATLAPSLSMARPLRSPRQTRKRLQNGVSLARSLPCHFANAFAHKRGDDIISPTASLSSAFGEMMSTPRKAESGRYAPFHIFYGSSAPLPTPDAEGRAKEDATRKLVAIFFRSPFCLKKRYSFHFIHGIAQLCRE